MMNMRQPILATIAALIQGGDEVQDQVMGQLTEYDRQFHRQTIHTFVWNIFISILRDSEYNTDIAYLQELLKELQGELRVPHRLYVFQNFVEEFTDEEVVIFGYIGKVLEFLENIVAEGMRPGEQIPSIEIAQIEHYFTTLNAFNELTLLYKLFISEIITACLSVELDNRAWQYYHHPIPKVPYFGGNIREHRLPDITSSILWAKKYYAVLEGKAEGYITWYINPDSIVFALH